jgi:hypothetical protein
MKIKAMITAAHFNCFRTRNTPEGPPHFTIVENSTSARHLIDSRDDNGFSVRC